MIEEHKPLTTDDFIKNFLQPVFASASDPNRSLICAYTMKDMRECNCQQCRGLRLAFKVDE